MYSIKELKYLEFYFTFVKYQHEIMCICAACMQSWLGRSLSHTSVKQDNKEVQYSFENLIHISKKLHFIYYQIFWSFIREWYSTFVVI